MLLMQMVIFCNFFDLFLSIYLKLWRIDKNNIYYILDHELNLNLANYQNLSL